jgi:hypothetical protein
MKAILTVLGLVTLTLCSACHKKENGVPNNPGAASQDHAEKGGKPVDGSQGTLIPESRH